MHCNKELLSISVYCPVHAGSGSRGICAMGDEAGGLGARFQMLSVRSTPMAATARCYLSTPARAAASSTWRIALCWRSHA